MSGRWLRFCSQAPQNIFAGEVAIMVVEAGDIDIKGWPSKIQIVEFVAVQLLRTEVGIGTDMRENWQPIGRGSRKARKIEIAI